MDDHPAQPKHAVLRVEGLAALMQALLARGHRLLGPRIRDGAIIYDDVTAPEDLPAGWTDVQAPGRYALERRDDGALFGYAVGPQSWKRFLHPPTETLFRAERTEAGMRVIPAEVTPPRFAFLGVRACEIAAIAVQDRVFLAGPFADAGYGIRRADAFIVAVNCGTAGGTCFCTSMGTGPKAEFRLRPGADRADRRWPPCVPGRDRQRCRGRGAGRPAA